MIDLFDLYNRFCTDNNTFQGGFFRPERDFERAANTVSQDWWNELTDLAEKTQDIDDNLSPFLKSVNVIVIPTSKNEGIAPYPKTYGRYSAARVIVHQEQCLCEEGKDVYENGICKSEGISGSEDYIDLKNEERIEKYKDGISERPLYKVESSRWASLLNHKTKCPTFENPGLTQYDKGFKVSPRQVSVIVLDYFVEPKAAKFVYSNAPGNPQTGAGDYIIYNKQQSTPLEWPETMIPRFLEKLRDVYARYTRDPNLFQMTRKSA
jgi:hypothetical protein